jgi:hypothetical protein
MLRVIEIGGKAVWASPRAHFRDAAFLRCLWHRVFSMMGDTTFCIWQAKPDPEWQRGRILFPPGDDPDGSVHLLGILDGDPRTYQQWAEEYYARPISLPSVEHIYARKPLTEGIVHGLNPDTSLSSLANDIAEIGYATG